MKKIRIVSSLLTLSMALLLFIPFAQHIFAANDQKVVVAEVHDNIDRGLYAFLSRAIDKAEEQNAKVLVLDIKSPGGYVDAALDIGTLLQSTDLHIITYVNGYALSAGSYIALHGDELYMKETATIGASQAVTSNGNAAGVKVESAWTSAMVSIAEAKGRKAIYAEAMANPNVNVPEYRAGIGQLLTLTADEAMEVGYAKGIANSLQEVLQQENLADAQQINLKPTFFENLVQFITNPIMIPILLTIAAVGLVFELFSPGFGVSGLIGLIALGLFFFGHLLAGLAGLEVIVIFAIGFILVIAELFIPGGIIGAIGAGLIIVSLLFAGASFTHMALSIIIAIAIAIVGMVVLMKFFGKKMHVFNKLVLKDATTSEEGYVSNENRTELVGKQGMTLTPLRPAGVVEIEGERLDVVSEGTFVDSQTFVKVVKVEGSRIVVRKI